jgi:hypothetical protein
VEQSEIEHAHHHTGRPWWDLVLGISAIVISLVSVFLAIHNGHAMERLVQANSWPFIKLTYTTSNTDGTPHNHLDITNKGVGPASIESLEVFYEGQSIGSPRGLLNAMLHRTTAGLNPHIFNSTVVHNVLSAKEQITLVDFHSEDFSPEDYATVGTRLSKVELRACYCSVFEECWVADTRKDRPVKVNTCPVPGVAFD